MIKYALDTYGSEVISSGFRLGKVSSANHTATDLVTSADGTIFALRAGNATEIRGPNLSQFAAPTSAALENILNRVAVSVIEVHPTGARIHSVCAFPEVFAMLNTDVDGFHGGFSHYRRKWPAIVCRHNRRAEHRAVRKRSAKHRHLVAILGLQRG